MDVLPRLVPEAEKPPESLDEKTFNVSVDSEAPICEYRVHSPSRQSKHQTVGQRHPDPRGGKPPRVFFGIFALMAIRDETNSNFGVGLNLSWDQPPDTRP
jgi:hypothetical protein